MSLTMRYVEIDYTNWKGERSIRKIVPRQLFEGKNEWHPELQWLVLALDLDKQADRNFAMKDIHSWTNKESSDDS